MEKSPTAVTLLLLIPDKGAIAKLLIRPRKFFKNDIFPSKVLQHLGVQHSQNPKIKYSSRREAAAVTCIIN